MNTSIVKENVTKQAKTTLTDLIKKPGLKTTCEFFSDNPDAATVTAVTIAAFKGVFRPLFTMMDKNQDPETKTYAAFREALTELVAIPIYIVTPFIVEKGIINKAFKNVDEFTKKDIKASAKFLSVCAATLIIPAICNVIQKPVMNEFKNWQDSKKAKKGLDINLDSTNSDTQKTQITKPEISSPVTATNKPSALSLYATTQKTSGMRVGN